MRCRACQYNLNGTTERRCPECGRAFDPDNPATFDRESMSAGERKRLAISGTAVMGVLLLLIAYAESNDRPIVLVALLYFGIPGLTILLLGLLMPNARRSRLMLLVGLLPGLVVLISYYSLALHARLVLGEWPNQANDLVLPSALHLHIDASHWTVAMTILAVLILFPILVVIGLSMRRCRFLVAPIGLGALAVAFAIASTILAPDSFQDWWWD